MLIRFAPIAACLFALATAMPVAAQAPAGQAAPAATTTQGAKPATPPAATTPAATTPAQPNSQQSLMTACNAGAKERNLSGDPRKQFMSDCLAGRVPPTPPPAATTGNSQQEKMKTCNAEATAKKLTGDARKTFMSTCLRG